MSSYESVPLYHGPQWDARPKERVEFLLNALSVGSSLACMIMPCCALGNYPQGFLLEPVMTLEKVLSGGC